MSKQTSKNTNTDNHTICCLVVRAAVRNVAVAMLFLLPVSTQCIHIFSSRPFSLSPNLFFNIPSQIVLRKQITDVCDGAWDGHACIEELQANQNLGLSLFHQPTSVVNAGWHLANFISTTAIVENVRLGC